MLTTRLTSDSKIQEASCIFIDAGRQAAAEFLRIVLVPRVQDLLLAKDPEISIELCHTLRAYPSDEFCSQVVVPLTTDGINFPKAGPATADLLADKLIPFVSTAPEDISRAVTKICESRLSDNQSLRSVPSRFESTNKIVTALLQKLPKGHAEANFDLCNWLGRYCHDASLQMPWYATADKMPDFYGLSFTW